MRALRALCLLGIFLCAGSASASWTCEQGLKAFCACKPALRHDSPALCALAERQCEASFCSPICLANAWRPVITVDCSLSPGWQGCPAFAQELKRGAGDAIIAQFQGYVCSKILGCCAGAAESVQLRVEETLYGDVYPHKRLPLKTCSGSDNHDARTRGVNSGFADAAHGRSGGRRATCDACQRATRVHIAADPSMCLPRSSSLGAPYAVQPDSIYERCTYVQDLVVSARGRLVPALQDAVCACAGCCNADGDEEEEDAAAGAAAAASVNSVAARSSSQQPLTAASAGSAGKRQRVCLFDADDGEAWLGSLLEESAAWLAR